MERLAEMVGNPPTVVLWLIAFGVLGFAGFVWKMVRRHRREAVIPGRLGL
jgi:hypothetical protein